MVSPTFGVGLLTVFVTARSALAPVTMRVALAGAVLEPLLVVVTEPTPSVFVPVAVAVTCTVTVQLPLAGIVPPLRATLGPLAAAVTIPPVHVVAPAGAALLVMLAG